MATTVIHFDYAWLEEPHEGERQAARTRAVINENIAEGGKAGQQEGGMVAPVTTRIERPDEAAIVAEAEKGYGFLVIGREPASEESQFHEQIGASAVAFSGPFAIIIARGTDRLERCAPARASSSRSRDRHVPPWCGIRHRLGSGSTRIGHGTPFCARSRVRRRMVLAARGGSRDCTDGERRCRHPRNRQAR